MEGIQLLLGVELDILDQEGSVDLDQEVYQSLDITVASIHGCLLYTSRCV